MPPRHFVQWIEVFVTLGMGVLHRHPRAKLDMLLDRLPEGLVIGHAHRIERGQVQLDEALPLGFVNLEMTMYGDQGVNSAAFPAKATAPPQRLATQHRHTPSPP